MVMSAKLLRALTRYANETRCACSACRSLRENYVKTLEDTIKDLKKSIQKPEDARKGITGAVRKTLNNLKQSILIILGVLLLISLINSAFPLELYSQLFSGNHLIDPLIGAAIGSISSGNALVSYILGGELQKDGISLLAVTAFMVSWVTVGITQLPAEGLLLGKRFALIRNLISFFAAILVALITVMILG